MFSSIRGMQVHDCFLLLEDCFSAEKCDILFLVQVEMVFLGTPYCLTTSPLDRPLSKFFKVWQFWPNLLMLSFYLTDMLMC